MKRATVIEILATISARKPKPFTAGVVLWDDVVVEAAPIVGFMKRQKWTRDRVRHHCAEKGWEISVVWQMERVSASAPSPPSDRRPAKSPPRSP